MELNLSSFPNNAIHVAGFCGEDEGIVTLNALSKINTVFSYD
jgi:hypothetical protein